MIPLKLPAGHPVTHVTFAPDGCAVAVAQPHTGVTLLERTTGRTLGACPMPKRDLLTGLAFSGDGRFLVAASAKGLDAFDATSGARVGSCSHRPSTNLRLATFDGGVVGVNREGQRRELPSAALTGTDFAYLWPTGPMEVMVAALGPGGRTVIGTQPSEHAVRCHGALGAPPPKRTVLFDLVGRRVVATLERADPDPAKLVATFCPLGRRFALNNGRTLDVYSADEPTEEPEDAAPSLVQRVRGGDQTAVAVAPMPHVPLAPTFVLGPEKVSAEPWRPPFALLPDGRGLLVKRPRNRVQLWDAPSGTLVNEWGWQFQWGVTCLEVSADGLTAIAGGRFGRVLLWDLE